MINARNLRLVLSSNINFFPLSWELNLIFVVNNLSDMYITVLATQPQLT